LTANIWRHAPGKRNAQPYQKLGLQMNRNQNTYKILVADYEGNILRETARQNGKKVLKLML
jgi:hypothetical protein